MDRKQEQLKLRFQSRFRNDAISKENQDDTDFHFSIDLNLPCAGLSAIYGPSGSGKTTLLRCVAGLEKSISGECVFNEDVWQKEGFFLDPWKRPLAFVFQEANLFNHLSVEGNLTFAIKRAWKKTSKNQLNSIVELMGVGHLLKRNTENLSGGERQRIAIARALLMQPSLLLLDEPLSALDEGLKQDIIPYLIELKRECQLPMLYVSHSIDEITQIADHLILMEAGRVRASGEFQSVLARLDSHTMLKNETGVVVSANIFEYDAQWGLSRAQFDGGELWLDCGRTMPNTPIRLRILARDVSVARSDFSESSVLNRLKGRISEVSDDAHSSAMLLLQVNVGSTTFISRITKRSFSQLRLQQGAGVCLQIKSVAILR